MPVLDGDLLVDICLQLGLDPDGVTALSFAIRRNNTVVVDVTREVTSDDVNGLRVVLEEYQISIKPRREKHG